MPFTEPIILVKVKVTLLGLLVGTSTSRKGLNLTLKQPVVCLRASWQWNRGEALSALWHRLKRYRKQTKEKKVLIAIKTHCRESRAQQLAQSQEFFCCCVLFFFKWRRHLTWRGGGWVVAFPHLPPHAATMQCTKKVLVFLCTLRRRCHQLSASSMINPLSPHRRGGRGGRVRGGGKWRKKNQIRRRNTTPTRSTASKHSIRASLGGSMETWGTLRKGLSGDWYVWERLWSTFRGLLQATDYRDFGVMTATPTPPPLPSKHRWTQQPGRCNSTTQQIKKKTPKKKW